MSTILKALQRLEDEKSTKIERSLDERIVAHRPPPEPSRLGLWVGSIAIVGLALGASAYFFWPFAQPADSAVASEAPAPEAALAVAQAVHAAERAEAAQAAENAQAQEAAVRAAAAQAAADQRIVDEVVRRAASDADAARLVEVVQRLDAQPADSRAAVELQPPAAAAPNADEAPPARGANPPYRVASAARNAAAAQRAREAQESVNLPAAVAAPDPAPVEMAVPAPAEIAPPSPAEMAVPAPAEMAAPAPVEIAPPAPAEIAAVLPAAPIPAAIAKPDKKRVQRAALPELIVAKTIWHPDAERRIAIVKLMDTDEELRLKEGDAFGPFVVESIKPNGVLFNHDGVEIHYNVGG